MDSTITGLAMARLYGRNEEGRPLVAMPASVGVAPNVLVAWLAADMTDDEYDALAADAAQVLIAYTADSSTPIIVGVVRDRPRARTEIPEEIVLEARDRIVIHCGAGRIVLTGEGRIEVLGERVSQRSRGVHSIKGAAVRIN
jgi:hypothetical protein